MTLDTSVPTETAPVSPELLAEAARQVSDAYPDLFGHQRTGVAFLLSRRRDLAGSVERPPRGRWYKLMHPAVSAGACVVVDVTGDGRFDHFSNVRIRTLADWDRIFGVGGGALRPYAPPDRGITSNSRAGRIECDVMTVAGWQAEVRRFLERCRDHWIVEAGRSG